MADFHQRVKTPATVAVTKVPNPKDYGVAIFEDGLILKFLEKPENPPSRYVSAGLYLLPSEIFDYHPGLKFSLIEKDIFPN